MHRNLHSQAVSVLLVCAGVVLAGQNSKADVEVVEVVPRFCALVIGVTEYDELPDLQYCDRDAAALAEVLTAGGFAKEHVTVMTQDADAVLRPTKANIRQQLEILAKQTGETVIVSFSGHGCYDAATHNIQLVPSDASQDPQSMISLTEVSQAMAACDAKLKLILLDVAAAFEGRVDLPDGVTLMISAGPDEASFESPKLRHGVFSYYVNQALRGAADFDHDGTISIPELELYTKRHVPQHCARELDRHQMPYRAGTTCGLQPIVTLPWREPADSSGQTPDKLPPTRQNPTARSIPPSRER